MVATFFADLRYASRRLRSEPGFTVVSILTLALGIGASTAIFSAVSPILFEPLPYPHAERLVMIWDAGSGRSPFEITYGTFRELEERSRTFEALAAMKRWQPAVTGQMDPERLEGQRVTAGYFKVLGISPALGGDFDRSDDGSGGRNVVILSDGLWRRRFGGDPSIVGSEIKLDDTGYTVAGVMPHGFENVLAPSAEAWSLLQYGPALPPDGREWGHHLRMAGRLEPGARIEDAERDLAAIAGAPVPEFARVPWASLRSGFILRGLQEDVTGAVRPALLAVLGAVILVLAIACVNVTNLLLARAAQRRGELAMRAALGAARSRLIGQLLTESVLLAILGGSAGLLVAGIGVRLIRSLAPPGLPRAGAIEVDAGAYVFAFGVAALIGVLVGLVPALHVARDDPSLAIRQSSRRSAEGHHLARRALVVVEVALALMLLVGAGLLLRSLERLFAIEPGFDASHMITMQVLAPGRRFDDDGVAHRFYQEALDTVRRVPGVAGAAFTSQLPLSGDFEKYGVKFESSSNDDIQQDRSAFRYAVTPGYFETLGIPLRRGRLLDAHDDAGAPPVVVINESYARRRLPRMDPIGQRLRIGADNGPWRTIVGVVGDTKQMALALGSADAVYLPATQWAGADRSLSLVVRARGDAAALAASVRKAVWSVDRDQPIVRVATMESLLAGNAAERRFAMFVFEAFAAAALALAAIGIYGVLSGGVTERTREIGVRTALGATRASILALILRQGMTLAGLGTAIGLIGAVIASQAIATLLFGISRLDTLTYVAVVALLAATSAAACWLPAWRAARVDPSITLRAE